MTAGIVGVHPYADKFPMLPESGMRLVGSGSGPDFYYVMINESVEHPGYFDVYVAGGGSIVSTARPCSSRELIAEMIHAETRSAKLRWRTEGPEPREAKTPKLRTGGPHVYFVSDEDGYIKIGTARNVEARLASLQTSSRQTLSVIGTVEGDFEDERRYHEMFAADRVRGEWFRPSVKLARFIKELTA